MQCSPPTAYCVGASVKLIALRPGSRRCSARRRAEMSLTATQRSAAAVDDDQTISPHEGNCAARCILHAARDALYVAGCTHMFAVWLHVTSCMRSVVSSWLHGALPHFASHMHRLRAYVA